MLWHDKSSFKWLRATTPNNTSDAGRISRVVAGEAWRFLYDEFRVLVSPSTISRALATADWTKKVIRQVAQQRNKDLRDFYIYNLTAFQSYHLVFVDESGCDKRIGSDELAGLPSVSRLFK